MHIYLRIMKMVTIIIIKIIKIVAMVIKNHFIKVKIEEIPLELTEKE